jgi:hypothetical protein
LFGTIQVYYKGFVSIIDCNLKSSMVDKFLRVDCLKSGFIFEEFFKRFSLRHQIDVFDIFIVLFDFGDCACSCNNFTSCDCWKTPIRPPPPPPPLGVIWGHWAIH